MPPKEKTESTELQVFNLENLNPPLLPELATFKEIQLKVVAENPFIAITDVASRDLAKKYRTARKTARTDLEKQDKLISSKFNEAKTKAKSYIAELIDYTLPGEIEQQKEIDRDEAELEAKRQEKARLEQQRIDNIKKELEDYVTEWKNAFNLMTFDSIIDVSANFLESYTSFDTTILQEFEALFPTKVEELSQLLSDRTVSLTNAENARLEIIRLEEEAEALRFEKARLEALARIAEAAELKAKKEREDFEKEKAEFEAKKKASEAIANAVYDLPKTIHTVSPEMHKGVESEEQSIALIQNIDSSVPELPTVNVCTSEEPAKTESLVERMIPLVDAYNALELKQMQSTTTWDDIEKDFKSSGEKSYSKWLKSNYNVPTKL